MKVGVHCPTMAQTRGNISPYFSPISQASCRTVQMVGSVLTDLRPLKSGSFDSLCRGPYGHESNGSQTPACKLAINLTNQPAQYDPPARQRTHPSLSVKPLHVVPHLWNQVNPTHPWQAARRSLLAMICPRSHPPQSTTTRTFTLP